VAAVTLLVDALPTWSWIECLASFEIPRELNNMNELHHKASTPISNQEHHSYLLQSTSHFAWHRIVILAIVRFIS